MAIEINPTKNAQAVEIITANISKLPANTPMDYGTVGALRGATKRESEAHSMALYFVQKLYGVKFTGNLPEDWTQAEKDAIEIVDTLTAQAIAKAGK
jgi:hypothetical protein